MRHFGNPSNGLALRGNEPPARPLAHDTQRETNILYLPSVPRHDGRSNLEAASQPRSFLLSDLRLANALAIVFWALVIWSPWLIVGALVFLYATFIA